MVSELREALTVIVAPLFFFIIIGLLILAIVMKPARWGERQGLSPKLLRL